MDEDFPSAPNGGTALAVGEGTPPAVVPLEGEIQASLPVRHLTSLRNDRCPLHEPTGSHTGWGSHRLDAQCSRGESTQRRTDQLVARSNANIAIMRGRPMDGWLRVASNDLRTRRQLTKWVDASVMHTRSLPPNT